MSIRSKHVIWHHHFIPLGLVWFGDDKFPSLALCRFVLRRWSRSEGRWIYARLGEFMIGDMTK